ncbi:MULTISPECIES: hypothetical protein [Mesonia]|uniref:Uncharacterized protein n=1 Tax=Mesonia oceanica TaxID=2687242 RepID=A0AC61Y3Z3_9FLAO|nr:MULTISPECIES: hypothetical protein [Mesonia]VVU99189.1 hypothetical protein FVB9532_00441 [Mesonia oceanica]|tara:strand:+ start:21590 stop:22147 length:558 start_codon:yes stop_codon:yes gene_type:complete
MITIIKIILLPVICALILFFIKFNFYTYPIPLGVFLGITYVISYKKNRFLNLFLNVLFSFIVYFTGYLILLLLGMFLNQLSNLGTVLAFVIAGFFVSPILLFFAYNFLFTFPKTKFSFMVKTISVLFLAIYSFVIFKDGNTEYIKIADKNSFLNPYLLWQPVMLLAIQLILHQKELKALFKTKNR